MFPTIKLHGSAKQLLGDKIKGNGETKAFKVLPKVNPDGSVDNMPSPKKGTLYLVNAFVFNALANKRDDLVMFDDAYTLRDGQGRAISQGEFIYSEVRG